MAEKVVSKISFEIKQIERLLASYAGLLATSQQTTPALVEITALASVLHSFYMGLENIFLVIAKDLDEHLPYGEQWHRNLLTQMTRKTEIREQVISTELAAKLDGYLGFRHFFRHSYSFFLEWDRFSDLIGSLSDVWEQARKEIEDFENGLGRDKT